MKNFTYYIGVLLTVALGIHANAQSLTMKIANKDFDDMRYQEAIDWYEQILKRDKNNHEATVKLAESYRKMNDIKNTLRVYSQLAHEEKPDALSLWHYAQALASNKEYEEAAKWYDQYACIAPDDPAGKKFATAMRNIRQFYQDSAKYRVMFAASLNTWQSEFSPDFFGPGVAFLSNRKQETGIKHVSEYDESAFLDFYLAMDTSTLYTEMETEAISYNVSTAKDRHSFHTSITSNDSNTPGHYRGHFLFDSIRYQYQKLTTIITPPEMSKKFHEGPGCANIKQDTVYLTRNTPYVKKKGEKKMSHHAIYEVPLKGIDLGTPVLLPFSLEGFSDGHPTLTPDNQQMYFVSNRPGGKGGSDIWVVSRKGGKWSQPINVEELNTPGDEMFPRMDPAGNLYFSSDGRPGLGGLDIFRATIKNGKIATIKNVGYPFNSSLDDFGMVWNKSLRKGFLSSNRKRGFADDDIYGFELRCQAVTVMAYDSITNLPLDSVRVVAGDQEAYTDSEGRASFCMNPGDRSFSAGKEAYEHFSVVSDRREVPMPMRPIHFELAGVVRSEEDKQPMAGVNIRLIDSSGGTIKEIVTDSKGDYKFQLDLNSTYTIVAARKSCGINSVDFSTIGLKTSQVLNGDLTLLCIGDIVKIENIYYDLNKSYIRKDAEPELNKLAETMWKYPDMKIELRSHTDSRSSKSFNMKLSALRAQAAVDYLLTKGIIPSRVRAAGYGESLPVNKCVDGVKCSEEDFQKNRRTEFKVLSIK